MAYTDQELQEITQYVLAQIKGGGTNVKAEDNIVADVGQIANIVGYGTDGKVKRISPNKLNAQETQNKTDIANEITRATEAETELLARLQGTSENSNAANDPFKRLPKVSDVTELMTVLDAMHGGSANSAYNGRFRVLVGSQDVDIYNYVLGYQYDTWVQEIRCPYELYQTYTDKSTSLPNGDYYLARKYNQELRMVSSVDYRGGTRTLRRMHNVDKWTNWVDTTNPYINSPLYGKNILLLGGSFAHNTRAAGTSNSGYGFTLFGREYSLQNYVAQELGLNRFDNYAISGNGSCVSNFTYNTFAQLDAAITYADEQEYTYDGIVIFGGVNDYMNNSPLGTLADPMGDDTFYASFKKIINRARTKYPTAKLYLATPFKGFSKPEFYNPASMVTNDAGHRYYEYVQALKEVAHFASIPLLDIYSIHQVDTNNYGRYTRSSADDVLHPNGLGYQNIALPLIEFLAWGKGAATFNNEALQFSLKKELEQQISAETLRAEKAETFLTPVPNTYWRLEAVGKTSSLYSNTGYKSIIVPVREGDKFIITAEGDGLARTWGTLDENKVVLRYAESYPQTNTEVTIAAKECYLVVNCETAMLWDVRITSTVADNLQQIVAVADRATEKGRQLALRDLYIAAGALYNDTDAPITRKAPWGESVQHLAGHYYLNGLGDITEEQMMAIYSEKKNLLYANAYTIPTKNTANCRTLITNRVGQTATSMVLSLIYLFGGRTDVEVIGDSTTPAIYLASGSSLSSAWRGCTNLKHISSKSIYVEGTILNNAFNGCASLETVYLRRISTSVSFADSPNLSKNSLLFIIDNSKATSAITITLHPDAYARLAEDSEIVEALTAQPLVTLVSA